LTEINQNPKGTSIEWTFGLCTSPPRRADITYRPRTDLTQLFFGFLSLHAYQTINPIRLDQVYQDINPNGVRDLSYQIKPKCQLSPAKGRTEASLNKVQTLNPMITSDILLSFCVADFYLLLKREYHSHQLHQITLGNRQPFDKANRKSLPPKAQLGQLDSLYLQQIRRHDSKDLEETRFSIVP
jgi:hypothetical protein